MTKTIRTPTLRQARRSLALARQRVAATRITIKDALALLFSAAALAVSVSTLYATQFRITNSVQARLAEFDTQANGVTIARFMVSNSGNRPAIVLSAHYILSSTERSAIEPWGGPSYDFNEGAGIQKSVPIVLQPRDMRLIELAVPQTSIATAFKPPANTGATTHDVYLQFRFLSLDGDGNPYDILTPSLARFEVSGGGWRSMTYLRHPRYMPFDLFSSSPIDDPRRPPAQTWIQ